MKKKSTSKIFAAIFCIASSHAFSEEIPIPKLHDKITGFRLNNPIPPNVYDLDPLIVVTQNVNEKGLVVMSGKLTKPFTNSNIKLSIKYQDTLGNWVTSWCKTLYSYNQYNEILTARFELPASVNSSYNLKVELSSDSTTANFSDVAWEKAVSHYKLSDYTATNCDLDENEYTILLTPKKDGTLLTDSNGKVTGIKDRVTSAYSWNKLSNVIMSNKKDDVVFSPANPAILVDSGNGTKSVKMVNQGTATSVLGSTPEFIYNEMAGHPIPYLYSYNDPVYMFAGKFSINGFMMKFSQWPGDANGPGYHNFVNPNQLQSRYFNTYNTIYEKLVDFITDQEPVVIVSSLATGFRVYKSNGQFITIKNATGSSNYGALFFGYGNDQSGGRRGPGSENLIISNTPEMTLFGMGALRNDATTTSVPLRSLTDIESEIAKFANYVGIFGNIKLDTGECSNSCFAVNAGAQPDNTIVDWTKAPNSYIFTGKDYNPTTGKYDGAEVDGLNIPVKKAYAMWSKGLYMGGATVPTGTITADVLWEDNIGLIKSGTNYTLELIGTGENAKIKVPINKVKKGNAVITYKINGEIYWSWHVWVTDDPTNGTTYKSFDDVKRELSDGTLETIPNSEWGFMDRNLGAIGSSLTGEGWAKNGGLLYQWGRKDPIPPLVSKGNDSYEVSGSIGNVLYRDAYTRIASNTSESFFPTFSYINFETLKKYQNRSTANVTDNIRFSVKNPLSLIYIKEDTDTSSIPAPSLYSSTNGYHYVNWFGNVPGLGTKELSKVNLWSDNSKGIVDDNDMANFNDPNNAKPYRNKSSYDPCPNGWRVPSVLSAYSSDNLFTKYSPYGIKGDFTNRNFSIPPGNTLPSYLKGIKVYPLIGFDMNNINGSGNMGIYPGTGFLGRGVSADTAFHLAQTYTDQHETYLWTATMTMLNNNNLPYSTEARYLRLTPDATQLTKYPDQTNYPNVFGEYTYNPMKKITTNSALGCRCIKDPLFVKNNYVFNPDFYKEVTEFKDGLDNPNSYLTEKSSVDTYIEIPVNKAFSVQSQYLGNTAILNSNNYNSLKANVLWSDRNDLITNVTIINPNPSSLADLNNSKIRVKINANKIGNAVVTLHNGSITNPVYWSWHIWVSNTAVSSITYKNDTPVPTENYVNYTKNGVIQETTFMDRNLGAVDVFPDIIDTENPSVSEKTLIDNSQGLHYQWGRKDPIPTFLNIFGSGYSIYTGNTNANGDVSYNTPMNGATYNSTYPVSYNTYKQSIVATDKIDTRIAKILKYSVENPLRFMKPNAAYKIRTDVNYTLGADWLIDTEHHNLYPERWGRDGKKSVFDPCPKGWRIPETVSGALGGGIIKDSPWSLKTNIEGSFPYVGNTEPTYFGVPVRIPKSSPTANESWRVKGFVFNNSNYNIGKYPKGYIRGFRNTANGAFGDVNHTVYNTSLAQVNNSGVWYSVLTTNFTGRGNFLGFDSAGRWGVRKQEIDPYVGMNCRCVKVKTDIDGNEQGPVLSYLPISPSATQKATNTFAKAEIEEIQKDNKKITVFPNPVKSTLYINADDKDYYYQIYNISGQLVKQGKFENKQTDVSSLNQGVYLVRINNAEAVVKIIKH